MACFVNQLSKSRTSVQDGDQKMFANCGTAYKAINLGSKSFRVTFSGKFSLYSFSRAASVKQKITNKCHRILFSGRVIREIRRCRFYPTSNSHTSWHETSCAA